MGKLTTEEFIAKAKAVHGDRYDYSKVEYVDNKTKVCIICNEHGEFMQLPALHLKGHGCVKCSIERNSDVMKKLKSVIVDQILKRTVPMVIVLRVNMDG